MILEGLIDALSLQHLFWMTVGVMVGMFVGMLPGLTATMGTALLVPFTFALDTGSGIAMLGGLYVCAMFADAIPAVLVNTPGTPAAMATALDGHQMTLQGRSQEAIVAACFSSALGTLFGAACYLLLAWPMIHIALKFGPPEFFWLGIFALTIIGSLAGRSLWKGLAGGALGMMISAVGLSHAAEISRFTFGMPDLRGGLSLVAALIGVFAVPQVLEMVSNLRRKVFIAEFKPRRGVALKTIREVIAHPVHLIRSATIGSFIGILPGAGSPIAALVSYNEAVRWTKKNKNFGNGDVRGVTASEIANNAAAPASMIPMVTMGVPGSAPAAVIAGAIMLRGLNPGPELYQTSGDIIYSFGWSLLLAGVATFIVGTIFAPLLARIIRIPLWLLAPLIMFLAVIGSYAIRNTMFDVYLMLGLGVFVFLIRRLGFHPGPIGLGLILGPIIEPSLVQGVYMSYASSIGNVFFSGTVNIILITLTVLSVAFVGWTHLKERGNQRAIAAEREDVVAAGSNPDGAGRGKHEKVWSDRDLWSALVLLAIGALFYSALGDEPVDWVMPRLAISFVLLMAAVLFLSFVVRLVLHRKPKYVPVPQERHAVIDVLAFCIIVFLYMVLVKGLGFWLASLLMLAAASMTLMVERTRRNMMLGVVVPVGAIVVGYFIFQHVFYVPVPEGGWLEAAFH